jgi:hypothetical protein
MAILLCQGCKKNLACSLRAQDIKQDIRPSYTALPRAGPYSSFVMSSHWVKSHPAQCWQIP